MPKLICDCVGYGEVVDISTKEARIPVISEGRATSHAVQGSGYECVKFRGKFQEGDAKNKNGRCYPIRTLREAIEPLTEAIAERGLIGEMDHPTTPVVHWQNASHVITKLEWDGKVLYGEAETLPTPWGRVLAGLLKQNVRVGISSRGVGDGAMSEGVLTISPGFRMVTWDIVVDPSTRQAFVGEHKNEDKIPQPNTVSAPHNVSSRSLSEDVIAEIAAHIRRTLVK